MISPLTKQLDVQIAELPVESESPIHGHVLVVEDDPAGCRLLETRLRANGHHVTACCDPKQAQSLALTERPDVIITDVCMPEVDGIEFTKWVRNQDKLAKTPLLLITALNDGNLLSRGLAAGADDFLSKPLNSLEIKTRVQSLLRNRLAIREIENRFHSESEQSDSESDTQAGDHTLSQPGGDPAQILLIDDDEGQSRLLTAYLGQLDCKIHHSVNGQAGLDWMKSHRVDLVVTDLLLPDLDGFEVIKQVRSNPRFEHTPVLAMSVLSEVEDRVRALNVGADDFILKGFTGIEFRARTERLLRLKLRMDELRQRYHEAAKRAVTDSLTGLVTHGYICETLAHELQGASRAKEQHSVIFVDVDHFKAFNDTFGHALGDEVLHRVAGVIVETVRTSDTPGRYGGEEFVISLPRTTAEEAALVAERIRQRIESVPITVTEGDEPRELRITASLGVATFPTDASDVDSLLQHADEAMYAAKQAGRNSVVAFGKKAESETGQRRVLVVDDEEQNIRLIKAMLAAAKYEVLTASCGLEALEIARHSRPDVFLLDAMMPGMTGFDVCRRLKSEPGTRLIPVILVTALTGRSNKLKSIEAGADAFISKPVDKEELRTQVRAFLRNKRTTDALEDAETVIFTLARAVEGRDEMTGGHVERVSHYAVELGKTLGLSQGELKGLREAGVVHDIGKISIPDAVLMKPGKLDEEERRVIEQHVELGYELLKPLRTFADALPAVRYHHERLDGSGYPLGLRGDEIPLSAQILAIADVYDALTTDRVYRKAFSQASAFEILREETSRGLHNPKLVETFLSLVQSW